MVQNFLKMDEQKIKKILYQSREYFLSNRYVELCGVVFKSSDKLHEMKNENPGAWSFSISPRLYMVRDKIELVVHSHAFGDSYPSRKDIGSSLAIRVPYLIYSCLYDNFVLFDLEKCKHYKV